MHTTVGRMRAEFSVPHGRIDFRHGGNNPAVVESVVRKHGVEDAPSTSSTELSKPCRVRHAQAQMRYLPILDTSGYAAPLKKETMERSYARYHGGRDRFERQPVRVMYVHLDPSNDFNFSWNPLAHSRDPNSGALCRRKKPPTPGKA